MPYLAFDLDAKKLVPQIAKSAGVQPCEVGWGLLELWDFVWSRKETFVGETVLMGCFGPNIKVVEALISYGFLEKVDGGYRVRGADRYLRVSSASDRGSMGGKKTAANGKSKSNLKQFASEESVRSNTEANDLASDELRSDITEANRSNALAPPKQLRSAPASSEQRAANDLFAGAAEAAPPKPKKQRPPDPRHAPMVKALCDAAPGYATAFDGRDAKAVTDLLAKGSDDEILRRWKAARSRDDFPRVRSLPELVTHWHHFAADAPVPIRRNEPQPTPEPAAVVWK